MVFLKTKVRKNTNCTIICVIEFQKRKFFSLLEMPTTTVYTTVGSVFTVHSIQCDGYVNPVYKYTYVLIVRRRWC
jgi:hypothetical protein